MRSSNSGSTWLLTSLKARGGKYLVPTADRIAELPAGSIVLFRYGHVLVGEAVVSTYVRGASNSRTLMGQQKQYEAYIEFGQGSIRLFVPPIPVPELQTIVGAKPDLMTSALPYFKLDDWSIYPQLLANHLSNGGYFL